MKSELGQGLWGHRGGNSASAQGAGRMGQGATDGGREREGAKISPGGLPAWDWGAGDGAIMRGENTGP